MPKPAGITASTLLIALFILAGIVIAVAAPAVVPPGAAANPGLMALMSRTTVLAGAIFSAVVAAIITYFYWQGQNWARWVVMIYSVLCLLGLLFVGKAWALSPANGALTVAKGVLALVLLWYLNTAPIRSWFSRKPLPA